MWYDFVGFTTSSLSLLQVLGDRIPSTPKRSRLTDVNAAFSVHAEIPALS